VGGVTPTATGRTRQCEDCGRAFDWPENLEREMRANLAAHGREYFPPKRCPYCRRMLRRWLQSEGQHYSEAENGQ